MNQDVTPPSYQQPPSPSYAPPVPTRENPGMLFSALGIVFAFIFNIAGLVLSIIGTVKSTKAKQSPAVGIVGIVLNIISMIVCGILLAIIIANAANGLREKAQASLTAAKEREQSSSSQLVYDGNIPASHFGGDSFSELIPATGNFFSVLTTDKQDAYSQPVSISLKSKTYTMHTFDASGHGAKGGRFGMFSVPNTTMVCISDYKNAVSLMIMFDPPNGDGNMAGIVVLDSTNCIGGSSDQHDKNGDIIVTPSSVTVSTGSSSSTYKDVYTDVASQIANGTMVRNIRAHFIG